MKSIDVPFLVVGAGPVGLMGGILLGRLRRDCLVLERRAGPQRAPAAHVVNARTFEICRQAGLDMEAILGAAKDPADAGHVLFVTRLAGEEIGRLPFERQGEECLRYTPTPLRNLSQHRFEPILTDEVGRLPGVDLRYGHQWESSEQDERGVTSQVRDLATNDTYEVRSRYVIAADGAGSRVRKALGIEMEGPPRIQSFLMIHFGANLRPIVRDRPGVLHFVMDPEAGGVFVAHDIDREWVYMHEFDPESEREADFDDARCRALVLQAIGTDVDLQILDRGTWHMSAQVAPEVRDRRIFLAGDAAHRFPPTGGLGLNTGVQDIHGLAWKLAAVEDGWAPPAFLETYGRERLPVARENGQRSLENAMKMALLSQALGTDVEPTRARMLATLRDGAARPAIASAIAAQAGHFDMLGLQLGYTYGNASIAGEEHGGSPHEYVPSGRPGSRLPHAWLETSSGRVSSLDVVGLHGFTLLSWGDHARWAAAVAAVEGVPVEHVRVGVEVRARDEAWTKTCGVGTSGAVLVRPDQHVAWRWPTPPADPCTLLRRAVAEALGRSPETIGERSRGLGGSPTR